ncbi:hypothetical protein GGF46_002543 [Coemansia sp. RSA 552]|nr:hypothetical protein GGF46_002543 [Coemansia sp. RSA 552]
MKFLALALCAFAAAAAAVHGSKEGLDVPQCPATSSISFTTAIPSGDPCPATRVDICYTDTLLNLVFTAYDETTFYYDPDHKTNDDVWAYNAMEAFIYKGDDDPQTYFEYEVSPNNVTFNALIFNPSRKRAEGAPMDRAFISDPFADGFKINTALDRKRGLWTSSSSIPLALFNGENPCGSTWRMNFFRTITSPQTFPDQKLCGWRNTGEANFHITPAFGTLHFI